MRTKEVLKYGIFLSLFFISSLSLAQNNGETSKTVEVWGEAQVDDGNVAQAKKMALKDAFKQAIIKVMGVYISAHSFLEHFSSIDRAVLSQDFGSSTLSKSKGYIKTYDIVKSTQEERLLRLLVKVEVSKEMVKDDLRALHILLDTVGNPVIMINGNDEGLDKPYSTSVIEGILQSKGFYIAECISGGHPDIILQSRGMIKNQTETYGLCGAVIDLKVNMKQWGTQRLLYEKMEGANGAGLNKTAALKEAYEKAAEIITPDIIKGLSGKWQEELVSGRTLKIVCITNDYTKVEEFHRYLGRLFGVERASLKSFENQEANFFVRFLGQSTTLADMIATMHPNTIAVSVDKLNSDLIVIHID
jgi:hypothetical protein